MSFYGIHHDKPVLDFTNHVMACGGCNPRSDRYCEAGKVLHKASNPSVGINAARKNALPPKRDENRKDVQSTGNRTKAA